MTPQHKAYVEKSEELRERFHIIAVKACDERDALADKLEAMKAACLAGHKRANEMHRAEITALAAERDNLREVFNLMQKQEEKLLAKLDRWRSVNAKLAKALEACFLEMGDAHDHLARIDPKDSPYLKGLQQASVKAADALATATATANR